MVVDLRPFDAELTGKVAQSTLDEAGHHAEQEHRARRPAQPVRHERPAHRHAVGDDAGDGASRRWPTIAALIARALRERDNGEELAAVRKEVAELCARFPAYPDGDPHLAA